MGPDQSEPGRLKQPKLPGSRRVRTLLGPYRRCQRRPRMLRRVSAAPPLADDHAFFEQPTGREAAQGPTIGAIMKPWPMKPLSRKNPSIVSTGPMIGLASGEMSYSPAH